MDANDIVNALEGLLGLGDTLDSNGAGILTASNGQRTTREVLKLELGMFLLYVGDGGATFTDGQASLVNLLLSDQFGQIPAWRMKSVVADLDAPDPNSNTSLKLFKMADKSLSEQNGYTTTQMTDLLINLYESFGQLMVLFNDNPVSKGRCDRFVSDLRRIQGSSGGYSAGYSDSSSRSYSSGITANDDFEIEDDELIEYSGTDKNVTIPRGITRISNGAFSDNETMEKVTIPASIRCIGEGAFWDCAKLKEIVFSEGVTEIEERAFYGCESLEIVKLPSTVTSIGEDAFNGCDNLKRIKVPAGLREVGDDVFYDCDKLEAVIIYGNRRSPATINYLKSLFPDDLDVFWEGDPQENVIVGQVIRNGHNVSYAFKPGIVLSLPEDQYSIEIVEEGLFEGNCKVTLVSEDPENPGVKELMLKIREPWGDGDDVFEKIESRAGDYDFFKKSYQTKPRSHMMLSKSNFQFDIAFSKEKVFQMDLGIFISDEARHRYALKCLIDILNGLTVNGELFSFGSLSSDALIEEWMAEYTAFSRKEKEEEERKHNEQIEKGKKKIKKHIAKYNDMFSFDLPAGSELFWKDGNDGSKLGEISTRVLVKDDGELQYDKAIVINDLTVERKEENADSPKSDLELMIEGLPDCRHKPLCSSPETALVVSDRSISILGSDMKVVEADILINYAPGHILRLLYANSLQNVKEDKSAFLQMMLDAAKYTLFNGKLLEIADLDCEQLAQEMILDDFEAESSASVGMRIVVNGKEVARKGTGNDEEEDGIPFALPQVSDEYHEHYTLVTSGSYTTRRDADFIGQPIRMLMEKCGSEMEEAYDRMLIPHDDYKLDEEAIRLAKVFRLNEDLFDPYSDVEAMIRLGMFQDVKMFHALRSLAWIVFCKADREGKQPEDYSFEDMEHIGEAIEEDYLHYCTDSYCSGLCSHYDWRVFYVPDSYLGSSCERMTDLRQLCGKENRSGNSTFMFMGGAGGLSSMNRINDIISHNEETLESLESLRKDLTDLLPVMKTVYEGLLEDRDRSEKLEGVLAEALNAWCALAVAAKEPFYSEEASDSYETDAGLEGPMERPDDELEEKPAGGGKTKECTSKPKAKPAVPAGDVMELNGATVIEPNQFAGNMELKNIIIPEGVTEIGERAFYSCMYLESVVLPKSLKKIGRFAFMSCRALKKVELQEGVEEIETHAFGATNNLKEIHLPDGLKKIDQMFLGMGGDSPYATAYLSGKLAKQLYDANGDQFEDLYARHLVIDGKPYESVKEYLYKECDIKAKNYYPPYDPNAAAREAEKRVKKYREDMETACKEGKTLQEMIDAGKKVVNESSGDKEAFETAIKNLDRNATVTFAGKHFVLTGFGESEKEVTAEIEKRGGIIHSSMVKSADYLVVCLESPGAAKIKKALEWREKGASNLIVSDYQMWQAVFGKPQAEKKSTPAAKPASAEEKTAAKPAPAPKAAPASAAKKSTKPAGTKTSSAAAKTEKIPEMTLDTKGQKVITQDMTVECRNAIRVIIPEGVTEIESWVFRGTDVESFVLPKSLKKIGSFAFNQCTKLQEIEIQDGLESIGMCAFDGDKQLKDIYLPDSIKDIDSNAIQQTGIKGPTIHLSSELARRLEKGKKSPYATSLNGVKFEIEGDYFKSLKEYMSYWEKNQEAEAKWAKVENRGGETTKTSSSNSGNSAPSSPNNLATNGKYKVLKVNGSVLRKQEFNFLTDSYIEIPEGVTEIEECACGFSYMQEIKLPKSLRKIGQQAFGNCSNLRNVIFQEGIREIEQIAFTDCKNLNEIHLPDSLQKVGYNAFSDDYDISIYMYRGHAIIHMSGALAKRLFDKKPWPQVPTLIAGGFVIDGQRYRQIEDFIPIWEASQRKKQLEQQKQQQKISLTRQIQALEKERDSLTGLFAGLKRRKLQSQIDELKDQMRRL